MKQLKRYLWLMIVLALVACGSEEPTAVPTEEPEPTAVPTEVPAEPTEELAPTVVPTEVPVEPTAEPTELPAEPKEVPVEPTAVPTEAPPTPTIEPTPAVESFNEMGVSFTYSPDLNISQVTAQKIPAQLLGVEGAPFYFTDVPEFIEMRMDTPQGPAIMYVRPIRDADNVYYATQPADLVADFTAFEEQIAAEGEGRIDQQQLRYLDFASGRGLHAVSYQFETDGVQKITNQNLYYFFDGFTADGRYYVNLSYPIDAPILEDSGDFTDEEREAAEADFDAYVLNQMSPLGDLTADEFSPSLAVLDEMIASIAVAGDASTEISVLANDPDCTNDAAFIRDVTIADAAVINPGETFTKIWEVQNVGTCTWTSAYTAAFINGEDLGWTGFVDVDGIAPGENFQIAVDLTAPRAPGIYEGRWQMVNEALEPFGVAVFVTIVVPQDPITRTPSPVAPISPVGTAVPKDCVDDAIYVDDITIEDGQAINPGERFTKIWEIRNTGTCTWTADYALGYVDGAALGWDGSLNTAVADIEPGDSFQISLDLIAPQETGIYEGRWQLLNDNGQPFGVILFVPIFVPEEPIPTATPEG